MLVYRQDRNYLDYSNLLPLMLKEAVLRVISESWLPEHVLTNATKYTNKLNKKILQSKIEHYFGEEEQDLKDGSGLQFIEFDKLYDWMSRKQNCHDSTSFEIFNLLVIVYSFQLIFLLFYHFWQCFLSIAR